MIPTPCPPDSYLLPVPDPPLLLYVHGIMILRNSTIFIYPDFSFAPFYYHYLLIFEKHTILVLAQGPLSFSLSVLCF